jgi:hypothetical protein
MANRWKQPEYIPTPMEIEQKCQEIRERWSERERQRRMRFVVCPLRGAAGADRLEQIRAELDQYEWETARRSQRGQRELETARS